MKRNGKNVYEGGVKVNYESSETGKCNLGIEVVADPNASSGVVAAPEIKNGLAGAGNAGQVYTPSCPKDFAKSQSEFNKSITISGSSGDTTEAPDNPETEGQREVNVTVYSPVKDPPESSVTLKWLGRPNVDEVKTLNWDSNNSVASAIWGNVDAGSQLQFCVSPADVFDTETCKTGTKEKGKALIIYFGTFEGSYNEDGKKVTAVVNFKVAAAPQNTTYGPIPLTIYTESGEGIDNTSTNSNTFGNPATNGPTVAQSFSLQGVFDGIEPGKYKVCVSGNNALCSPVFEKKNNMSARTEINVSEADSEAFLATGDSGTSCGIEGIGWIVCPILGFLGTISDTAFDFLASSFLETDVRLVQTSSPTYNAWQIMRNIANVAFVIAFLFIIFSQLTGYGVSNYGVKKMLPRLVVAAILVNISFFVCQLAVDISNILGYSLKGFFDNIGTAIQPPDTIDGDATGNGFGIAAIIVGLIAGGITVAFSISIPILLAVVVALLMIVLILLARTALIILLIVISPLAFVAYLLPNTEDWFKKWSKLLFSLLLLFPIIAIVFGASGLAAKVIFDSANGDIVRQLMAVGIAAVPLFVVPSLLKGALNASGQLGAKLSGWANKAGGGIGKKFGETSRLAALNNARKRNAQIRRAQITGGTYDGKNPFSRASSKISGAINTSRLSGKAGDAMAREGTRIAENLQKEDLEALKSSMQKEIIASGGGVSAGSMFRNAVDKGDLLRARAALSLQMQTAGGRTEAHSTLAYAEGHPSFRNHAAQLRQHLAANHPGIDAQDSTLGRWANGEGTITGLQSDAKTYQLNDEKMAGQAKPGLVEAAISGALDAAMAGRIIASDSLSRGLKPDEREFLQHVSAGGTPSTGAPRTRVGGGGSVTDNRF